MLNYVKIKPIDIQIVLNNYYARFYRSDNDKMITKEVNNYRAVTFLARSDRTGGKLEALNFRAG